MASTWAVPGLFKYINSFKWSSFNLTFKVFALQFTVIAYGILDLIVVTKSFVDQKFQSFLSILLTIFLSIALFGKTTSRSIY